MSDVKTNLATNEAAFLQKIDPSAHECAEWSRMAKAAYASGRNKIGHRFSAAASEVEPMALWRFDMLQAEYREWLVFGEWSDVALKVGDVVRFHSPNDDENPATRYRLIELNGDRCFVEQICDLPIRPQACVMTSEIVRANP